MSPDNPSKANDMKNQLGVLLQPKNLAKTIGSQIPIASAGVEMLNQLEGEKVSQRLAEAEAQIKAVAARNELEKSASRPTPVFQDWSIATAEFLARSVDLAVAYDAGFHSAANRGREMVQVIAHGCLVDKGVVLTCKEALDITQSVAEGKYGKMIAIVGMAFYELETEAPNKASGLCLCRLTKRDEKRWQQVQELWKETTMPPVTDFSAATTPVKNTVMPWIGQEVGFLHDGEAKDIFGPIDAYSSLQFDTSAISHFRRISDDSLKSFVTGVLPGRFLKTGSAVFGRDGTLLGILSGSESYESDAGRRGVVRSLLGHPRFTTFTKRDVERSKV